MNIQKVLVIGAGTMGSGIAQWFAQQNVEVELVDNNSTQTTNSIEKINSSWEKLAQKGKFSDKEIAQFKINLVAKDLTNFSANADLAVEAIIENLEIKKVLFSNLDKMLHKKAIIASNTSSFPMKLLNSELSEERKKNFLGLHFFNPATIMKLVEIIKSESTDELIVKNLYSWFEEHGKKPATCKDSPGFIVNRVARNFYGEPLRILEDYDEEKIKEIDTVLKKVAGFRMGPFELMDLIGIDINYSVTQSVWKAYGEAERFAPHKLQKQMVESGKIGRKSKQGFYTYE